MTAAPSLSDVARTSANRWWSQALAECDLNRGEPRTIQSNREFLRAWRARRAASVYLPVVRRGPDLPR